MEKKSLLTANWLKAALLLMVMCFSGLYAQANTTNTVDLGEGYDGYIKPGQTYTIPANTIATGRYFANYDGTITFTSSVNANTNLVPFTDNTYTDIVESVRDEEARTKTFVIGRNKTFYFKSVVSTTPYEVKFDFVRPSNQEDYVESIVPEDGSEVSSLKDFTINFTTNIYGARNSAKLYKGETLVAEKALGFKANVNTYSFSFDEEITEPGDYTLVIPEESFVFGQSMIGSTEWKFVYTIEAGANYGALPVSITPANGSTVGELQKIVFEFSAADYPNTMSYDSSKNPLLYNAAGEVVAEGHMGYEDSSTYMSLYVNFETPITEEGVYTLKVPEGAMHEYGYGVENPKVCPAFEVTYTIGGGTVEPTITATWSIEEGAVIDSFESVSLTFEGVEKAASKSMYPYAFYKVEDDGTAVLVPNYCSDGVMDASASGTTITYSIDRECYVNLYGGNYRIVIPAGSVKFNGDNENLNTEEYVLNFTLNAPAAPTEIDAAFTADPANNSTVSEIREIILSFPDYSSIELAELDMMQGTNIPQAFMEDELTGSYMPAGYVFFEAAAASNALRLYVPVEFMGVDAYTTEGNYKIVIPAGVVKFADGISKEISLYYTVKAAQQPNMIVSLVGGATAEEAVTFNNLNATATFENTTATITSEWTDFGIYGVVPGAPAGFGGTCYVHYSAVKVSDTEYSLVPNADELATLDPATAYQFKLPEGYFTYADGSKSPAYETWIKYEAPSFDPVVITINPAGGTEDAPVGLAPEEFEFTVTLTGAESVALGAAASIEETCIYLQSWVESWQEWSNAVAYKPELVEGTTYKLVPFDEYWADALNYLSAGKYRIHIPSGTFVFNGNTSNVNAAFDAYYTAVFPDMTVDPTPDTVVEQLDHVSICFNNESLVTASETVKATLKKDGVAVEEVLGQVRWGVVRNTVGYWFTAPHLDAGEYEFVIPADALTFGSGKVFEGATFKYTIEGETPTTPAIVVTPAGGTEEEPVEITEFEFIVKAENATRIDYAEGGGWMAINGWVTARNGSEGYFNSMWPTITRIDDTTLKLTLDNYSVEEILEGTTNGKYQLYIAAGDLWFNGDESQTCEEISLIYTYNSGVTVPEMVISPAVGSEVEVIDAETITVSFKNVDEVAINPLVLDFQNDVCILIDPKGNWISVYPEAVDGATNTFKFVTFDGQPQYPFTTAGTYGFYIPTGSFLVNGAEFEGVYYEEYITIAATSEAKMIVTPEDGATIESYKDIKISFEGATTVEINPNTLNAEYGKMMLVADDNWQKSVVVKPVEEGNYTYGLEILDGQLPETYSTLMFFMEEGSFFMDGNDAPGVEYTYNVDAPITGDPEMIVTPAAGTTVKAITSDVITISFKNVKEVTISDAALNEASCKISIIDPKGNYIRTMPQAIEGETNMFRLVNFDGSDINLTAEGTYGIWINGFPVPAFYMDGKQSPEFYEKNFLTVAPYTYVAEPAEGIVASIETVALSFDPAIEGMNKDAAGNVVLYKDGEEVESLPVADLMIIGWGAMGSQSLAMEFSKAYTAAGEYKIVIPAGAVQLAGGIINSEIALNYTIVSEGGEWTAVADPAPGVVAELTDILVTFEGASQLSVSPEAGPNDFPYYGTVAEDGTVTKVPYSIFAWLEGGNKISLGIQNAEEKLSEPGKYAIIIPAAYCLVDGIAMTEDIRFDYTIEGAQPEYTIVLNPADGATVNGEQLYEITVTFDGAKAIELNGDQATSLYQLDENGNPIANIYQTMSVEGNVAKFTVMELHKPYLEAAGTFQFTIPVGMVTITDNNDVVGKNKENIVATYYSNGVGVDTIGVDAKDLNIYTVNGMLIKRNGTYEDVKALEPGIYIINGKKFYVK